MRLFRGVLCLCASSPLSPPVSSSSIDAHSDPRQSSSSIDNIIDHRDTQGGTNATDIALDTSANSNTNGDSKVDDASDKGQRKRYEHTNAKVVLFTPDESREYRRQLSSTTAYAFDLSQSPLESLCASAPPASSSSSSITDHVQNKCIAIIAKVCDSDDATMMSEQRYEQVVRSRLEQTDVEESNTNHRGADRQRDNQSGSREQTQSTSTSILVRTHIRMIDEQQSALIFEDYGGFVWAELNHAHWRVDTRDIPVHPLDLIIRDPSSSSLVQSINLGTSRNVLMAVKVMAGLLHQLHSSGMIHLSLNPSSVLLNMQRQHAQFVDLSAASLIQSNRIKNDHHIDTNVDHWSYTSPEQSGRAARPVDARSDLYSLGCFMFECTSGRPPYVSSSNDPTELRHKHLAAAIPSFIPTTMTHESHPFLHAILTASSAIVTKLLAKEANERYQSAIGLAYDIDAILTILNRSSLHSTATAASASSSLSDNDVSIIAALRQLTPGLADQHSTFRLSSKLYGRDDDIAMLQRCYDRCATKSTIIDDAPHRDRELAAMRRRMSTTTISNLGDDQGVPQLVLISASSGMGKTSLVDEFRSRVGLIGRSKFDLHRRDVNCILQALRSVVSQLVWQRDIWRDRLLTYMGTNIEVIVDAIPELIDIVGEQASPPLLDASDTAKRFERVIILFVCALGTSSSPLTLFIDDLQWANASSLALLQSLVTQQSAHLMIIGAYRSNEVDDDHPLTKIKNEMTSLYEDRIHHLRIASLSSSHITSLIVDSFQCDVDTAAPLATLLYARTRGNPYFVSALLRSYYDSHLLTFDFRVTRWCWSINQLKLVPVHDDIVDVLCERITKLSSSHQQLLQYASCIGHSFDLSLLAITTDQPISDVAQSVLSLKVEGIIELTNHQHLHELVLISEYSLSSIGDAITLSFVHDKLQSASSQLISADRITEMHCIIADRMLSAYTTPVELEDHASSIVYHINQFCNNAVNIAHRSPRDADNDDQSSSTRLMMSSDAYSSTIISPVWHRLFNIGGINERAGMMSTILSLEYIAIGIAMKSNQPDAAIHLISCAKMLVAIRCRIYRETTTVIDALDDTQCGSSSSSTQPPPSAASSSSNSCASTSESRFIRLSSSSWHRAYADCCRLYHLMAQSFFIACEYRQTQLVIEYVFEHVSIIADRSSLYELHVQSLALQQQLSTALSVGLDHLLTLGVEISLTPDPELIAWINAYPDINDPSTYDQHPVFSLPICKTTMTMKLMHLVLSTTYFLLSPLYYASSLAIMKLTRDGGRQRGYSEYGFANFAFASWPTMKCIGDYHRHRAYRATADLLLSSSMCDATLSMSLKVMVQLSINTSSLFHRPMIDTLARIESTMSLSLECGEIEMYCSMCCVIAEVISFTSTLHIPSILAKLDNIIVQCRQKKIPFPERIAATWRSLASRLHSDTPVDSTPATVTNNDDTAIPILRASRALTDGIHNFIMRVDDGATQFDTVRSLLTSISALVSQSAYTYYQCLSLLSSCTTATLTIGFDTIVTNLPADYDASLVDARLADADKLIALMSMWSQLCPSNFEHKHMLMLAEQQRVSILSHHNNHISIATCIQLYMRSAQLASMHKYVLDEALANELLARFYISIGDFISSRRHIQYSYDAYESYEAQCKCRQLRREFVNIVFKDKRRERSAKAESNAKRKGASNDSSANSTPQLNIRSIELDGSIDLTSTMPNTTSPRSVSSSSHSYHPLSQSPSPTHSSTVIIDASHDDHARSLRQKCDALDAISILKLTQAFAVETIPQRLLNQLMKNVIEVAGATRGTLMLMDADTKQWWMELNADVNSIDLSSTVSTRTPISILISASSSPFSLSSSLSSPSSLLSSSSSPSSSVPLSICRHCILTVKPTSLSLPPSIGDVNPFSNDEYFTSRVVAPKSIICIPLMRASSIFGLLYLENDHHRDFFHSSHIELLQLLCSQASLSIDNIRMCDQLSSHNIDLERMIQQRTVELEEKNSQLILSIAKAEEATVRAENAMKEAERAKAAAEAATKVKASFLANMSHEIRTPMNAVLGVGRLLADTDLTAEQHEYVSMMTNSGNLLITIINDILDFSKIEAGELVLNLKAHNLLDVCESAIQMIQQMMMSRGLRANMRFVDPSIPRLMMIDQVRLQQILINLLSNAIKFTSKGGVTIRITGRYITPLKSSTSSSPSSTSSPSLYEVDIRVTDTGIGISASALAKLFKSFSQVAHSSGSEYGGTGLGLVIASRLVLAMNDAVNVDDGGTSVKAGSDDASSIPSITCISEVGVGSTFAFKLRCRIVEPHTRFDNVDDGGVNALRGGVAARIDDTLAEPIIHTNDSTHIDNVVIPHIASPSMPTPRCLYGLTIADRRVLRNARVLFIGHGDVVSDLVIQLLRCVSKHVDVCNTIKAAIDRVNQQSPTNTPSTSAQSSAIVDRIDVVVIDFQSLSSTDAFTSRGLLNDPMFDFLTSMPTLLVERNPSILNNNANKQRQASDVAVVSSTRMIVTKPYLSRMLTMLVALLTTDTTSSSSSLPSSSVRESISAHNDELTHTLSSSKFAASPSPSPDSSISIASYHDGNKEVDDGEAQTKPTSSLSPAVIQDSIQRRRHRASSSPSPSVSPIVSAKLNQHASAAASSTSHSSSHRAPRIQSIASTHPLRILLAEDNLINQKMMLMMMRKLGYTIMTAINGVEALMLIEREAARGPQYEIECILMDASMDVMDGMECTRRIRQEQRLDRVRPFIIAQTANVTDEYRTACMDAGMDSFIAKPVDIDIMIAGIKLAHQHHHATTISKVEHTVKM